MIKHLACILIVTNASWVLAAEKTPAAKTPPVTAGEDLGISIHGNQELPTVMHIVPWQEAGDNKIIQDINKPPLQDMFPQLERSEHQREVRYLLNSEQPDKK